MKFYWNVFQVPELQVLDKEEMWQVVHEAMYTPCVLLANLLAVPVIFVLSRLVGLNIDTFVGFIVLMIVPLIVWALSIHLSRPRIASAVEARKNQAESATHKQ